MSEPNRNATHHKSLSKILKWIVIASLVYCVASIVFVNVAFGIFFGRSDASTTNAISNYSEVDESKYPRQEVTFLSGDNKLRGYIYGTSGNKGLIILVHGIESCADDHLAEILGFVDNGWTVFTFDETGVAASEGSNTVGLLQAKLDLRAALDYVHEDDVLSALPLFLYGHSMGGYAVTAILAEGYDINAVVCVSGFNNATDVIDYELGTVSPFLAAIEHPFVCLHHYVLFGDEAFVQAVDGINASPQTPVLCVYGTEDELIPADIIGIPAYQELLQHHNVTFLPIAENSRNGHSALWLNTQAAEYVTATEGGKLTTICGPEIPNALDKEYIEQVESFLASAI